MIKLVKLATGEELIGDVSEEGSSFVIKHPCLLQLVPSRSNQNEPTMAMFPYAVNTKDHEIKVASIFVVWSSEPVKELYNQYNSVFGTGIVMSPSNGTTAFHPV